MVSHTKTYKKNSTIVRLPKKEHKSRDTHDRNMLVKEVVHECMGFAPYERRLLELLRLNKDRQAVRFANKRIGKFTLAKKKVNQISQYK
ncbi:Ribosomal_protein L36 [Hexamita inflata]|uniref:60S ribosomal protein L36 n=1 Tax=Hexamita inflata TaxID=28002 RepID=A0AA86PLG3_9EUKA|nr:Ribosomal protein L36 [Hexamita inflata]CAI9934265.1 Ribosomal protein L36 [Hexamita inflata]CAI9940700.1 Ribosomal protein L36 [Hexamita inflata]CAI9940703.1 Ribosomal protein L36 [Hexamita inflata]CAI9952038.1 Ribosomal protein L36 [Hexamita inflata]